ncbi:glycosyltransferase [Phytohalomonas tamaricis]|uniref:glycosyltransferase n=1 Tax=Phytohalomonas tamaricis TaxID=2081032 RepID=UPI001319CC51|nr:glycosyltransferase [Phytohalomonas tamaricis]
MPQRILLIVRRLNIGGIERVTVNLANTLHRLGHEVHILTLKKGVELAPMEGVIVHEKDVDKQVRRSIAGASYELATRAFLKPLLKGSGFFWRGIYGHRILKRFITDIEQQYGTIDRIIARGQGAFEAIWPYQDPRFWQVCVAPVGNETGKLRGFWLRKLYEGKRVVCNTNGVRIRLEEELARHDIRIDACEVIMNPCDIDAIRAAADEPVDLPARPFVVHVARLSEVKRQEFLIRAYLEADIEEDLVIVGDGPMRSHLEQLVDSLGVRDRVHLIGSRVNPYPWMKHARLFVLSSRSEGLGIVLAESMICGTPCAAVNAPGGVADVLINDQARLLAENNVSSLAEKIREGLVRPPVLDAELIERFRDTHIASQFLALATH